MKRWTTVQHRPHELAVVVWGREKEGTHLQPIWLGLLSSSPPLLLDITFNPGEKETHTQLPDVPWTDNELCISSEPLKINVSEPPFSALIREGRGKLPRHSTPAHTLYSLCALDELLDRERLQSSLPWDITPRSIVETVRSPNHLTKKGHAIQYKQRRASVVTTNGCICTVTTCSQIHARRPSWKRIS